MSRKLVLGLLITLAFVVSSFTYAFWASTITGNNNDAAGTISIGEGGTAATAVTVGPQTGVGQLVPVGRAAASDSLNPKEAIILSFLVTWTSAVSGEATGTVGTLAFSNSELLIGATLGTAATTNNGLFTITHQIGGTIDTTTTPANPVFNADGNNAITVDGAAVTVFVRIVFNAEPANPTIYGQVATANIYFTGTFTTTVPA